MIPALLLGFVQTPLDREALVRGVDSLTAPGALPGAVVASKTAFVVLRTGDVPAFAAGPVGRGRAMVGGHESFFSESALKSPSNARFLSNSLAWLIGRPTSGLKIGTLSMGGIKEAAQKAGVETIPLRRNELEAGLVGIDVLCMTQGALDGDTKAQNLVMAWTKAGHGLLTVGPAWGWQQLNPSKSLRKDLGANRMLLPFGLGFSGEYADGSPSPRGANDPLLHTDSALAALRKGGLPSADTARATGTVSRALGVSDLGDRGLVAEIKRLAAAEGTPKWPVTDRMPFSRLQAIVEYRAWEEAVPEAVRAHPSAADFPGPVPKEAKRDTHRVSIDTKVTQWHGTGRYAAPGEVITIMLPPSAAGKGLGVRIGSHTDELWHLPKWDRFPAISRQWPLEKTETKIASPFGGAVFIDVPEGCSLGNLPVTIAGAVPAPQYVKGTTTDAEWAGMLDQPGGPWVELEGRGIILSLPRAAVANLKAPEALMAFWDETMDRCYELYASPRRPRPERYCVDRQISAGYMHSGYPIMTGDDVATTFADATKLRGKGATWGFFHELGHNFQEGSWSFPGTGEVTNNLFSLYASEKLNSVLPIEYGIAHPAMKKDEQQKRLKTYLAKGARFADWQGDPFLALTMYAQLREAFDWEPFTKAFAEYRRLGLRPNTETQQHDAWLVQMSRATGRNLGPFFMAWGVPTSDEVRKSIAELPGWMPADWPKS